MQESTYEVLQTRYAQTIVYGVRISSPLAEPVDYRYISCAKTEVDALIRQMQNAQISSIHYPDIVRDYLFKLFADKLSFNGLSL